MWKKIKGWHIALIILLSLFAIIKPFREGFLEVLTPLFIGALVFGFLGFLLKNPGILLICIIIIIGVNYKSVHSKAPSIPGVHIVTHYDYFVNSKVITVNIWKPASTDDWLDVDKFILDFLKNIENKKYTKIIFRYRFKNRLELNKNCYENSSKKGVQKLLSCVKEKNGLVYFYRKPPISPAHLFGEIEEWANTETNKIKFYQKIGIIPQ